MTPTNEQMAHECLKSAEIRSPGGGVPPKAHIEAMAAQTYATLALVDAVNDMRSFVAECLAAVEDAMSTGIRDTVAEEVSSALMDMKDSAHE